MSNRYIYWKCKECGQCRMSDKSNSYNVDWCNCGKSGIDAGEIVYRSLGQAKQITEEEYEEGIRDTTREGK